MTKPLYNIEVKLSGEDGNAFSLIGKVKRELRRAGASNEECNKFMEEAMSGDYNNVLQTCMRWVHVV